MLRKIGTLDLFDLIRADLFTKMEEFGADVVADLKNRISVPVEYSTGPNGGTIVIRSKPGEPPRLDTGALHASIQSAVEADADIVTLEMSSDRPYAARLEFQMQRYAWEPCIEENAEAFLDRAAAALSQA